MAAKTQGRKEVRAAIHTLVSGLRKAGLVLVCPSGSQGIRTMPDQAGTGRGAAFTGAAPTKVRSFASKARCRIELPAKHRLQTTAIRHVTVSRRGARDGT